jgi:hypothetical protein
MPRRTVHIARRGRHAPISKLWIVRASIAISSVSTEPSPIFKRVELGEGGGEMAEILGGPFRADVGVLRRP